MSEDQTSTCTYTLSPKGSVAQMVEHYLMELALDNVYSLLSPPLTQGLGDSIGRGECEGSIPENFSLKQILGLVYKCYSL